MKLQIETMLLSAQSPEDNDLQITWDVTASVNVREYVGGNCEPGEFLIEDIEIVAVRMWSICYGKFGAMFPWDYTFASDYQRVQSQRRLDWLNSVLDDRDDWTEAIRFAATREHMRSRDRVRN